MGPPALDPDREQAFALFREGRVSTRNAAAVLLMSLLLFGAVALRDRRPVDVLVLVAVLFLHELGHWAAMRLCGYQDTSIFFIPFFGAAASGRSVDGEAWKEGLVLLAGPLPGLLLGIPVLVGGVLLHDETARRAGYALLGVNAFNLLPLVPLDGGRLFELVLFRRHPLLLDGFRTCAAGGLGVTALWLHDWILGVVGVALLATLPAGRRMRSAVDALRGRVDARAAPAALAPEEVDALYGAAREVYPGPGLRPAQRARTMLQLQDALRTRTPGWGVSLGLLGGWVLGAALVAVAVVGAALARRLAG